MGAFEDKMVAQGLRFDVHFPDGSSRTRSWLPLTDETGAVISSLLADARALESRGIMFEVHHQADRSLQIRILRDGQPVAQVVRANDPGNKLALQSLVSAAASVVVR